MKKKLRTDLLYTLGKCLLPLILKYQIWLICLGKSNKAIDWWKNNREQNNISTYSFWCDKLQSKTTKISALSNNRRRSTNSRSEPPFPPPPFPLTKLLPSICTGERQKFLSHVLQKDGERENPDLMRLWSRSVQERGRKRESFQEHNKLASEPNLGCGFACEWGESLVIFHRIYCFSWWPTEWARKVALGWGFFARFYSFSRQRTGFFARFYSFSRQWTAECAGEGYFGLLPFNSHQVSWINRSPRDGIGGSWID